MLPCQRTASSAPCLSPALNAHGTKLDLPARLPTYGRAGGVKVGNGRAHPVAARLAQLHVLQRLRGAAGVVLDKVHVVWVGARRLSGVVQ